MTVEENKRLVTRFVDAVNEQRYDEMLALLADDFSIPPDTPAGLTRDGLKAVMQYYFNAFPDLHYTVVEAHFVHLKMEGTHRGDYQGHAGTGRSFAVDEVEIMRIRDGKIAGYQIVWDELAFRKQLGID